MGLAYDTAYFDLVIPPCTPSKDWLREVDELLDRNGAVRAKAKSVLERTSSLIKESASLLEAAVTLHATSVHARGLRVNPRTERVPIKCILIVDDYAPWRQRLRSMLHDYAELQSVAEAANGPDAARSAEQLMPDLILLDLNLPHLSGIEAARQICQVAPDATIVFVSMNKDTDLVREALNAGAKGYVLKTDAGSELWSAIETVLLQKNQYLSSGVRFKAESAP